MHGSGAVSCSCSLLIRGPILPAVRQKLHLSPCADSRSRLSIAAFVAHWWMLHLFQRSIEKFRNRLVWIYRTYFSEKERVGLDLRLEPRSYWYQPEVYIGLLAVSF